MNTEKDNTPTTGKERAQARLAAKLEANKSIPTLDREPSRQVKRAAQRGEVKARKRRLNEVINRANVRQRTRFSFLNRESYRRFMSNRAPKSLIAAVMTAEAEMKQAA